MAAVATQPRTRSELRRRGYPTPHRCLDCPTIVNRKDGLRCRSCARRISGAVQVARKASAVCIDCEGSGHRCDWLTLAVVHQQDLWCRTCHGGAVAAAMGWNARASWSTKHQATIKQMRQAG